MTPIFLVQRSGDLFSLTSVALDDHPDQPARLAFGQWSIQNDAALWLYRALAGHEFGTGPDKAQPVIARSARAWLAEHHCWPGGYYLANLVVQHFGQSYQPWLGLQKVGPGGKPIINDPKYQERIGL